MSVPDEFTGYAAASKAEWSALKPLAFKPKPFEDDDVDIQITHCGVCGSDLHTLRSEWGSTKYPIVVGHEIVGHAVRVGAKVTSIRVGDLVGVGANAWSCGECALCQNDNEQYCPQRVGTYNAYYPDGTKSMGGYSDYARINERFVFPIPSTIPPAIVAPMLCAGLTVFSPLVRNNVGPGSRVGVIGIGGLGHFAVMFAAALGAEVTAISHSPRKEADATKLGAKHFIAATGTDWAAPHARTFDLIINTSSGADAPLREHLSLLDVGGTLVFVGLPEGDLPAIRPAALIGSNVAIRGSKTGSRKEVLAMLDLAAKADVRSWVDELPMTSVNEAMARLDKGDVRYRIVLKN